MDKAAEKIFEWYTENEEQIALENCTLYSVQDLIKDLKNPAPDHKLLKAINISSFAGEGKQDQDGKPYNTTLTLHYDDRSFAQMDFNIPEADPAI